MIDSIRNYIEFLKKEYSLDISIHGDFFHDYLSELAPYNVHECAYCMYVKSSAECWRRCKMGQIKAQEKSREGSFFGSCYAGVGEFVFSVSLNGDPHIFISVGGYEGDPLKRSAFCEKYGFREDYLALLAGEHLKKNIPPMNLVKTLIDPLCAMLVLYIEKNAESRPLPQDIYGKILSIIHTGYSRKLRLTDIAAQCHYSVAFICRYFKNVSGESIGEYLHNVRMQKALKLILESKMPIGDVASACGFSDANYFISAFSNYYGSPPGKYRRENSK